MDEYQTRQEIAEFFRNKRKRENRQLYRAFGNIGLLIVGMAVVWFIQRNHFKP